MENKDKNEELKKLIEESAAFNDDEKAQLVAKIPDLSDTEMDDAILALAEEVMDVHQIVAEREESKKELRRFIKDEGRDLREMVKIHVESAREERGDLYLWVVTDTWSEPREFVLTREGSLMW